MLSSVCKYYLKEAGLNNQVRQLALIRLGMNLRGTVKNDALQPGNWNEKPISCGIGRHIPFLIFFVFMAFCDLNGKSETWTNTIKVTSVRTNPPAWLNPKQLPELVWGGFELHPRLRTTLVYDDNILFTDKHQKADLITQLTPGMQIVGGDLSSLRNYDPEFSLVVAKLSADSVVIRPSQEWPNSFVAVDYAPRWDVYTQNNENNALNQFASIASIWPMARLVIGLRAEASDERGTIIQAARRTRVRQYSGVFSAGYQINNAVSISTEVQLGNKAYPETTNLTGFTEIKGVASLNRQFTDAFNIGIIGAGGWDMVSDSSSQEFIQFGGRIRYGLTAKINIDLMGGVEYRMFDSGVSQNLKPFANIAIAYQLREGTICRFEIARQQYASLNSGYAYTATGGYFLLRQDFTDRFSLQGNLSYYQTENTPTLPNKPSISSTDHYGVMLQGGMRITSHMEAVLSYGISGSGLIQDGYVLQANQFSLSLNVHY